MVARAFLKRQDLESKIIIPHPADCLARLETVWAFQKIRSKHFSLPSAFPRALSHFGGVLGVSKRMNNGEIGSGMELERNTGHVSCMASPEALRVAKYPKITCWRSATSIMYIVEACLLPVADIRI